MKTNYRIYRRGRKTSAFVPLFPTIHNSKTTTTTKKTYILTKQIETSQLQYSSTHIQTHTQRPHPTDKKNRNWSKTKQQSGLSICLATKGKRSNRQTEKKNRGKFKTSFDKIYLKEKKSKKVLQTVANDSRKRIKNIAPAIHFL